MYNRCSVGRLKKQIGPIKEILDEEETDGVRHWVSAYRRTALQERRITTQARKQPRVFVGLFPVPVNQVVSVKARPQSGAILGFERRIFVLQTQLIDLLPGLLDHVHSGIGCA